MGYYSFYKIIKDIIKTLFGNKILRFVIITCLIALCLSLKTTVFGAYNQYNISDNFDLTYNNNTYHIKIPDTLKELYFEDTTQIFAFYEYSNYIVIEGLVNNPDVVLRARIKGNNLEVDPYININNFTNQLIGDGLAWRIQYNFSKGTYYTYNNQLQNGFSAQVPSDHPILYATKNIYNRNNNGIYFAENGQKIKYPQIATTLHDLETLNFDVISVNAWDYSNEDIDVLFYDLNYGTDTTDGLYPKTVITLNKDTTYFQADLSADPNTNAIYWIPNTETGLNFIKGGHYAIKIAKRNYDIHRRRWISRR